MVDQSSQKFNENRSLGGIRVLVTRPNRTPDSLVQKLESLGASAVLHPMIMFTDAPDKDRLRAVLERLSEFSIAAFLSRQAAMAFEQQSDQRPDSTPPMPPIAAIGSGTRAALDQLGYVVHFIAQESNSESMAELLIEQFRSTGSSKPILILRANRGSDVLPTALTAANVPFEELAIYSSADITAADPAIRQDLADGKFQWLTITSSSIAQNVAKLFADQIGTTKIVSISPTTTQAATEAGLSVAAEATEYNMDGLVDAIVRYEEA